MGEGESESERERAGAANRVTQILLQSVFELGWRWLPFDICCISSQTTTTHFVSSLSTLLDIIITEPNIYDSCDWGTHERYH